MLSHLKKEKFGYRKIRDIRISDAKLWIIKRLKGKGGAYYIAKPKMEKILRPDFGGEESDATS